MELNREKINRELARLGWSQSELARRMGMHRQQLNALLEGDRKGAGVHFKTVDRFADALGLEPKDLLI